MIYKAMLLRKTKSGRKYRQYKEIGGAIDIEHAIEELERKYRNADGSKAIVTDIEKKW